MKTHIIQLLAVSVTMIIISCASANKEADIRAFEFNDSGLKVITTYVNEKSGTMSTLYGNESALNYSIKGIGQHVAGEVFKLVTFDQQDHEFWYGSKINGALQCVETIKTVQQAGNVIPTYVIKYYGSGIAKSVHPDEIARVKFILDQEASVFP